MASSIEILEVVVFLVATVKQKLISSWCETEILGSWKLTGGDNGVCPKVLENTISDHAKLQP